MKLEFDQLEQAIKSHCQHGPVYYFANPGNWGDALIRHGALKFLKEKRISCIEVDLVEVNEQLCRRSWLPPWNTTAGTVLYGGGGGWCQLWNHSEKLVRKLKKRYHVIVLPSTYQLKYRIANTTFFSRDRYESIENMPESAFCHDMAFYLGTEIYPHTPGKGKGYFFRTDAESAGKISIPANNNDISAKAKHFSDIAPFFDILSQFRVIYTDRLHVAIASCLLGKEVHLFMGKYFKNRAIYLSSMKDYFENVHFHE